MTHNNDGIQRSDYVSLRDYFEARLEWTQQAVVLAREELYRRLDVMNHLQARMDALSETYLNKDEYEVKHTALCAAIEAGMKEMRVTHTAAADGLNMKVDALERDLRERLALAMKGKVAWPIVVLVTLLSALVVTLFSIVIQRP